MGRVIIRIVGVTLGSCLVVAGCSSGTDTSAPPEPTISDSAEDGEAGATPEAQPTPSPVPTVSGPPRVPLDEWVPFLDETLREMSEGVAEVHADYGWSYGERLEDLDAEVAALRAEVRVLRSLAFPGIPDDSELELFPGELGLADVYWDVLDLAELWSESFAAAADTLEQERDELEADLAQGGTQLAEVVDPAYELQANFAGACEATLDLLARLQDHTLSCPAG